MKESVLRATCLDGSKVMVDRLADRDTVVTVMRSTSEKYDLVVRLELNAVK